MKKWYLAILIGTSLAISGGVAAASIPDAQGVIHGCYEKSTHVLSVINSEAGQVCTRDQKPLNWNQSGPTGATGPEGPTGPAGLSHGWDAQLAGTVSAGGSSVQLSGGISALPPGSYLLGGSATWPAPSSGGSDMLCNMLASGTDVDGSTSGGFGTASTAGGDSVGMNGAITVHSGTATVGVECDNSGTADVSVQARIYAIRVDTLD